MKTEFALSLAVGLLALAGSLFAGEPTAPPAATAAPTATATATPTATATATPAPSPTAAPTATPTADPVVTPEPPPVIEPIGTVPVGTPGPSRPVTDLPPAPHRYVILSYEFEDPSLSAKGTTAWYREHTRHNPNLFSHLELRSFELSSERHLARLDVQPLPWVYGFAKLGEASFRNTLHYVHLNSRDEFGYDDGLVWALGFGGRLPLPPEWGFGFVVSGEFCYLRQTNDLTQVLEVIPERGLRQHVQVASLRFGSRDYDDGIEGEAETRETVLVFRLSRPCRFGLGLNARVIVTVTPFIGLEYVEQTFEGDAHAWSLQHDFEEYLATEDIHWEAEADDGAGLVLGVDGSVNDRFRLGFEARLGGPRDGSFLFSAGAAF